MLYPDNINPKGDKKIIILNFQELKTNELFLIENIHRISI